MCSPHHAGKNGNAEQHVFVLAIREYMHGIRMYLCVVSICSGTGWTNVFPKTCITGYIEIFRLLELPVPKTVIPSAERYKRFRNEGSLSAALCSPSSSAMKGEAVWTCWQRNRNIPKTQQKKKKTIMTTKKKNRFHLSGRGGIETHDGRR